MATILTFARTAMPSTPRLPVPAGGAAIVVFPGIRCERSDGGGKAAPSRPPQERKRRTKG